MPRPLAAPFVHRPRRAPRRRRFDATHHPGRLPAAGDETRRVADDPVKRAEHDVAIAVGRFRTRIGVIALITVALSLLTAAVAYWGERGAPDAFTSFWAALFWTTTQLLTVSSSLPNPERTLPKALDVLMELYAIVVVSSLAGTFTDLLHHRTRRRSARSWQRQRSHEG